VTVKSVDGIKSALEQADFRGRGAIDTSVILLGVIPESLDDFADGDVGGGFPRRQVATGGKILADDPVVLDVGLTGIPRSKGYISSFNRGDRPTAGLVLAVAGR
jgi:hypothetical protein